jgi:hypothetical protein
MGIRSLFCRHEWDVISSTYSPPIKQYYGFNERLNSMYNLGFVVLLLHCRECSKIRKEMLLGKPQTVYTTREGKVINFPKISHRGE